MTKVKIFFYLAIGLCVTANLVCGQDEGGGGDSPATDAPATDAPATDAPATDAPATDAPATDAPATEAPATDAPATEAPATEAPATEAPATEAPATEAPATEAPATEAPATDASADAPATEAPTEAPTDPPTTKAPQNVDPKSIKKCPKEDFTNNEDKKKCCAALNKNRAPFADCCEYPQLVIWRWQYNLCLEQTGAAGKQPTRCALLSCCLQYLTIIDDDVPKNGLSQAGFRYSFLLSVGNNTLWEGPIAKSVKTCFRLGNEDMPTDKSSDEYKDYWDCFEKIPKTLYTIVDCSYDYNFYDCPQGVFQEDMDGCPLSKQYVMDCFISGMSKSKS